MTLFYCANGAMPTTAALVPVTTGTAIKTMLQIGTSATAGLRVVKWGVEFATVPTAPITCELIETGAVAATVTAHVAAGVQPYNDVAAGLASSVTLSTTTTGYTASAEGTITATRYGDYKVIPINASEYVWEWSLGREFAVAPSKLLRVRMTTATAISAVAWVLWDE